MADHLDAVLVAVRRPHAITPDPIRSRWRYWRADAGPTAWLFVVVDWRQAQAEVVTTFGQPKMRL